MAVPGGVLGTVFQPQQLKRHAWLFQFLMERRPVGDRAMAVRREPRPGEQAGFQGRIVQLVGQRPAEARGRRALQIRRDCAHAHRTRLGNGSVAEPRFKSKAEQFA